jgi:hypothetical protein
LNEQRYSHDKGIKAVKPFQKHLQIHLASRQKASVTKRPIWASQSCFHYSRCSSNHHKGNQGNDEMS